MGKSYTHENETTVTEDRSVGSTNIDDIQASIQRPTSANGWNDSHVKSQLMREDSQWSHLIFDKETKDPALEPNDADNSQSAIDFDYRFSPIVSGGSNKWDRNTPEPVVEYERPQLPILSHEEKPMIRYHEGDTIEPMELFFQVNSKFVSEAERNRRRDLWPDHREASAFSCGDYYATAHTSVYKETDEAIAATNFHPHGSYPKTFHRDEWALPTTIAFGVSMRCVTKQK